MILPPDLKVHHLLITQNGQSHFTNGPFIHSNGPHGPDDPVHGPNHDSINGPDYNPSNCLGVIPLVNGYAIIMHFKYILSIRIGVKNSITQYY
jgi:hypothetical protein